MIRTLALVSVAEAGFITAADETIVASATAIVGLILHPLLRRGDADASLALFPGVDSPLPLSSLSSCFFEPIA